MSLLVANIHKLSSFRRNSLIFNAVKRQCSFGNLPVFTDCPELAQQHGFQICLEASQLPSIQNLQCWIHRNHTIDALEVHFTGETIPKQEKPFHIDFASHKAMKRFSQASNELVVKAVGKKEVVVDMTAGLGRDAMILASAGRTVFCFEENPIIYLLLSDALRRLQVIRPDLSSKLHLHFGTAEELAMNLAGSLPQRGNCVVYLDPMFPTPPSDRKSLVKKETQVLHRVIALCGGSDSKDNSALFSTACKLGSRVVVKRSLHDPWLLPGLAPQQTVSGSKQRFDIYFPGADP